jgi:LPS-assembly lipoprotein
MTNRTEPPKDASPSRRPSRRALLALALLPVAGCGFHPMYSETAQERVYPELASIVVLPIKDRYGQQLELALREAFNPEGLRVRPRYQLRVQATFALTDLGIQRDASATRARIDAAASFALNDTKTGKMIYSSYTQSTSAYNILQDGYAAEVAAEDAQTRTVKDLTQEIRTRLVLFLRDRQARF